ncbi:MAG TPA: nitronate monooxygenase family protein [Actinomycetota bacterium]|nr:nitronate monooxygenase family protein [Actinomycetota bacterium]
MIRTALCELLGIEHPIIQAGMGPFAPAVLAAAVSDAGGLGSIGTFGLDPIKLVRSADDLERQLASIRDLTDRPFAVNFVVPYFEERVEERTPLFERGLSIHPKVVSFALGDPGELVARVHDAGALAMLQITTVEQAEQAASRGVDIIVAQGAESGGYGGSVATMVLVPQVVDAVRPIPVVAAGGIFDGRGLAAALVLGAVGVNVGTRFLVSREATISDGYKRAILAAASQDAVEFVALNELLPSPGTKGYGTVLRSLRTPFIDALLSRPEHARRDPEHLLGVLRAAIETGNVHEVMPTAGQTAGGIHEVLPAAEIVHRMISEAEEALAVSGPPERPTRS